MSEIVRRTDDEQVEIEDKVLTLSEAGYSQRDIVDELGISFSSIKPYKERALARVVLPDSETVTKEDVLFYDQIIRKGIEMLNHPELGASATNRPQLLRQIIDARKARSKAIKEHREHEAAAYGGGTLFDLVTMPEMQEEMESNIREQGVRQRAWMDREDNVENMDDLEKDPSDGVYKLRSEFVKSADG